MMEEAITIAFLTVQAVGWPFALWCIWRGLRLMREADETPEARADRLEAANLQRWKRRERVR